MHFSLFLHHQVNSKLSSQKSHRHLSSITLSEICDICHHPSLRQPLTMWGEVWRGAGTLLRKGGAGGCVVKTNKAIKHILGNLPYDQLEFG